MAVGLLLKGGEVVDPGNEYHAVADVRIADGRIAEVGVGLLPGEGDRVLDVSGKIVTPGLIDVHAHVFLNASDLGPETDARCSKGGVTTIVDAGSGGSATFPGLKQYVADHCKVRLRCFVHLSSIGLMNPLVVGELLNLAYADPDGCVRTVKANPGLAIGVKLRFSNNVVAAGSDDVAFRLARRAADESGSLLMVHMTDSPLPVERVLDYFHPGDIFTHCFHRYPYGIMGPDQNRVLDAVREAQRRGVLFDSAHGRMHFNFDFARRAIDQGFLPDTISTDLTLFTANNGPVFDLPTTMSKFLNFGVSIDEVVRRVTINPARAIGEEDLGSLRPGTVADVTVLDLQTGSFDFIDTDGNHLDGSKKLTVAMTIKDGEIWYEAAK